MQAQKSPIWTTPVFAFCLSLIFSVSLAPALGLVAYQQYDFWLMWLVTMLVLALPFTIMEIALAKRVRSTPLHAFMQLTRDADTSTKWRALSWGGVIFVGFIAGGILQFASQNVLLQFSPNLANDSGVSLSASILMLVMAIIAVAASLLPRLILLMLTCFATLAVIVLGILASPQSAWQWTALEFNEWAKVVTLTLVTGGLGLGLYWQNTLKTAQQNGRVAEQATMPVVLPIWAAQALGLGAFVFVNAAHSLAHAVALMIAAVALSGLLLQYVREQLIDRQISLPLQGLILLLPVLIWAIPHSAGIFYILVITFGLLLCLGYAIFTGWLMKISHLRKSINFSNEASYNLWRILMRIVAPLAIVLALVGWIMTLINGQV